MALKKCKECGNEVSTKATSCPNCGAVLKKKTGCLGYIGAAFLIFIIIGVIGSLMNDGIKKSTSSRCRKWCHYVASLIMLWVLAFKIPFTSSYSI